MGLKRKPSSEDTVESNVLAYLKKTNRPYSATDISTNLPGQIGKTAVQRALIQLEKDGLIYNKTNGKQVVYCVVQEVVEDIMKQILESDGQLMRLGQEKKESLERNKGLKASLEKYKNILSLEQINSKRSSLKKENEHMQEKLASIKESMKDSNSTTKSKDELQLTQKNLKKYKDAYKQRKALFNNIFDVMSENMPAKPKQIKEDIGIDDDQDVGFDQNEYNISL